jgi:hypothetical protein
MGLRVHPMVASHRSDCTAERPVGASEADCNQRLDPMTATDHTCLEDPLAVLVGTPNGKEEIEALLFAISESSLIGGHEGTDLVLAAAATTDVPRR